MVKDEASRLKISPLSGTKLDTTIPPEADELASPSGGPASPQAYDSPGLSESQGWWSAPAGGRDVLRLAIPLVVSTVSWTIMHFIDRMFLFQYSGEAMAASLPAGVVSFFVLCLPLGICQYVNTFVSQYHGARRSREIGSFVWQGLWVALLASPVILATIPLAPALFGWANHGAAVTPLEVRYYQILCWGAPAFLISASLTAFFTGRGQTRVVMLVDASAAGVNIALDYAWIFGHWGFSEGGIAGAAWATNAALAYKMLVYFWLFLRREERLHHRTLADWRLNVHKFLRLLRFGGPAGAQLVLEVAGFTLFVLLVGRLGAVELAATNLAFNVGTLAFMPILGLSIAVTTMVGQYLGDNRDDLAARATWTSCVLALGYMTLLSVLYLATPQLFLLGFQGEGDSALRIRETTVILLRFVAAYNLFDALNMIFVSAIKGAGDTRFVLITTILSAGALILGSLVAVNVLGVGLYGCWLLISAWVWVVGIVYLIRFLHGRWRLLRVIEPAWQST